MSAMASYLHVWVHKVVDLVIFSTDICCDEGLGSLCGRSQYPTSLMVGTSTCGFGLSRPCQWLHQNEPLCLLCPLLSGMYKHFMEDDRTGEIHLSTIWGIHPRIVWHQDAWSAS